MMIRNEIGRTIGGSLVFLLCLIFGSLQTQTAIAADRATGGNTSGTDACLKANGQGFQWKPALMQSGLMLASQHALRMVQPKTRRELGGPFFSDYFESVSTIHTTSQHFPRIRFPLLPQNREPHLSLGKQFPFPREALKVGKIVAIYNSVAAITDMNAFQDRNFCPIDYQPTTSLSSSGWRPDTDGMPLPS